MSKDIENYTLMSKNCAICIGINDYYNLKPLQYAQNDALAMRSFCLKEAHFEETYFFAEGATPIEQDYGPPLRAEPTFGNLDRFLDIRFREPFLEAGDNLWFFFAGHGRRHANRDYLMPIDGNPGKVERTGLAISDIADRLRGCGADNIIFMLDACRGEDDRDGGEGIGVEQQQGVITLFSCSPSELSYEIDELQQGAFTYALLQGLRLQGEGNCATVERLYQHLRYQVPVLNQRYKKQQQTPYAIAEPATKLHLILLPNQATLKDVLALKNDALEAEAEFQLGESEQLWIRVLIASPGDRQAVKALQRIALKQERQKFTPSKKSSARLLNKTKVNNSTNLHLPEFYVDIVICIDATGSMGAALQKLQAYAKEIYSTFEQVFSKRRKKLAHLRIKVIAFRDYWADGQNMAMLSSVFLDCKKNNSQLSHFLLELRASGGGDEPENALEALALAIQSEWLSELPIGAEKKNIIMLLTDASAHDLQKSDKPYFYPEGLPKNIDELTDSWFDLPTNSKLLLLVAPESLYPWETISSSWEKTVFFPVKGGNGLEDLELDELVRAVANNF